MEMKDRDRVMYARQLLENPLIKGILDGIEGKATTAAIYAKDAEIRAEACYKARAARSFREDMTIIIDSLTREKGGE